MNPFSIWPSFGFRENPYSHEKLSMGEEGNSLLVGRESEVSTLQRRIGSGGVHATVEGNAGVGKSSLVAVASYRMMKSCIENPSGMLFLPAEKSFQIGDNPDDFEEQLFRTIAQTIINNQEAFRKANCELPKINDLDKWLNAPQYRNGSAGVFGAQAGYGSEPNTSEGFTRDGFATAVKNELSRLFPTNATGGIICVIDNLELLNTSGAAQDALEQLRDRIFGVQGIRWILCGSRGIVSRARSQRLSGYFAAPQRVGPLAGRDPVELIFRRINYFGNTDAFAPVAPESFEFLYSALNRNLRDALSYAQNFSVWLRDHLDVNGKKEMEDSEAQELLKIWLMEEADAAYNDARSVQRRVWQFFDSLAEMGGTARSANYEDFGFRNQQQFSSSVTSLENTKLVAREVDPDDGSRKLVTMTPTGWLVFFHRNRYQLPSALELEDEAQDSDALLDEDGQLQK